MMESETIKERAVHATGLSLVGNFGAQGLRLVSNIILSRLLFPEAFGLMAIVRLLMNGLQQVSDVGIGVSIVQHKRGDDEAFLNTAWTAQVIRGLVLWCIGCLLAFPFSHFYEEPRLLALIPVATSVALIGGLAATKWATLNRKLKLKRIIAIELSSQAVALVVMIVIGVLYRSVWALVAGALVFAAIRTLLSYVAIPGPGNRFHWDKEAGRDIISFGKWILLSTLVTFLAYRFDVLLLGKLLPFDTLGVYSIGIMISAVPKQVASSVIQNVLLPALSSANRDGDDVLASVFEQSRRSVILPAGLLVILGAALLATPFFHLLYDERYHDAGWIAQMTMISVWFFYLHEASGRALIAVGNTRSLAMSNSIKLVCTIIGCVGGFWIGGLPGLILGAAVGALAGYLVVVVSLPPGLKILKLDAAYTVLGLGLGLIGGFGPKYVAEYFELEQIAIAEIGVAVLILLPVGGLTARRVLRAIRERG